MKNVLLVLLLCVFIVNLAADWSIEQMIYAEDGEMTDYFGESVSISGALQLLALQ